MEEITDPEEKAKLGYNSDWKISIERPHSKGLSYAVDEEDDAIFNKVLREHIKNRDYRYAATAIRNDRNRLDNSTWELVAEVLEKAYTRPRQRPENRSLSKVDKRNWQIKCEYEEMMQRGVPAKDINNAQINKYHLSQSSLNKARKSIPRVFLKIIHINKK